MVVKDNLIHLIFGKNGNIRTLDNNSVSVVPISYPKIICGESIDRGLTDELLLKHAPKDANAYIFGWRMELQKKKNLVRGYESCSAWAVQFYQIKKEKENGC